MRSQRDTISEKQLELNFGDVVSSDDNQIRNSNNVVMLNFVVSKKRPLVKIDRDQIFLDEILKNAQKLNW